MKSTILALTFTTLIFSVLQLNAKERSIIIPEFIRLPQDSIVADKLLNSLESFLEQKESPNGSNTLVNQDYLLETSLLLDELKGIENSTKLKNEKFYKCHISSLIKLNEKQYILQFSYMGVSGSTPLLRATISLIATEVGNEFHFHSPLKFNTSAWSKAEKGLMTIFHKPSFDLSFAKDYVDYTNKYDRILGVEEKPTILYCASNFNEVLKLIGVDYKSDYSSVNYNSTMAVERDTTIIVNGLLASEVIKFDPHDHWHSRLRAVLAPNDTYKPIDEGCAFLFGGSWGYSWEDIKGRFSDYVKNNNNPDWLKLYEDRLDIGDEQYKPLNMDYIINAFIVKELYKDGDFTKVMKLLSIGRNQTNEKYFEVLEETMGINRKNFNEEVGKLIGV
ncbi:MAG: hypothetical protein WC121_04530 [Candidatus Kapaibacterium sp.]